MKILNTLSGQKEDLVPIKDNKVNMFVCGPTVYDHIHIGNARTFVFFDVVAKYLKYKGYDVNYIQNITDIDNKIIERAQKEGVDSLEYAKKYTEIFKQDMKALGITSPEYKNATDHITEVIKQVQTLLDKGNAYVIENDPAPNLSADPALIHKCGADRHSEKGRAWGGAGGIYFDISTFPDYGKLSGRTAGMADDAVSRIDDSAKKRNRGDFALWKFSSVGNPSWPAPFGDGRPGWHIEDTAITEKYFGPQYDIHGGGQDLIFPHHEAEIAQQESASGKKPFVKYWMHNGFLVNKEQKMSKSLGNFQTARELLEKYPKEVLRFYLLSAHYRSPLDFGDKNLQQSGAGVSRIYEFVNKLRKFVSKLPEASSVSEENWHQYINGLEKSFIRYMDNDFDTSKSLASLFQMIRRVNPHIDQFKLDRNSAEKLLNAFENIDKIFGIIPSKQEKVPDDVTELVQKREALRQAKDWNGADKIRAQIEEMGWKVEDTIYGPLIVKK